MHKLSMVCLALALVGGCSKKKEPTPSAGSGTGSAAGSAAGSGSDAGSAAGSGAGSGSAAAGSGAGSAGSADDDGLAEWRAKEMPRREGKKTGFGAPDEKPEVVTEDLLRKIAAGEVPVKRFIDPKLGVYDWTSMPGGSDKPKADVKTQRCADAEKEVAGFIKKLVDRETATKGETAITCGNEFVATEDPNFGADEMGEKPKHAVPHKHATCVQAGLGEYDAVYWIVWQPDAERGLHISAIVGTEQGAINKNLAADLSVALKTAKPCK